ncbi:hypothetical protein BDZ45DRAFT_685789 [Acephala macrosclerotiorum]|nr:hypothetical protein BDZ45DRAFT_685789 [Acephala macrosclerotiorum]
MRREGHVLVAEKPADSLQYPVDDILKVITFTRKEDNGEWNSAYSLFPEHTFLEPRETYPLQRSMEAVDLAHVKKYVDRGWSTPETIILPYDVGGGKSKSLLSTSSRYASDSKTSRIRLDTIGIEPPSVPDSVLEQSHFSISISSNATYYCIGAGITRSSVLKYEYTLGYDMRWPRFLWSRLDPLIKEELKKVDEEDIPQWIRQHGVSHDHPEVLDLNKPADWKCYDDTVPKWHEEWLEMIAKKANS